MSNRNDLPPFEIVDEPESYSHAGAKRLRIRVAISPEDAEQVGEVATHIISELAADNDEVMVFFHPSSQSADGASIAIARAQYVRNGSDRNPFTSSRNTFEIETPDGVITVEKVRNV